MASASETITVSSAAVGFTAAKYTTATSNALMAVALVENDAIRFWDDTQTPTASVGRKVAAGVEFQVCGVLSIRQFRMIRVATDATVTVSYYKGE
jgi:intracellular sulfur oxidation DsrE/DsrF family protein